MADMDPEDEEFTINPNEIVKVIDLDDNDSANVADDEFESDNEDNDDEDEDDSGNDDNDMETEAVAPISDDSMLTFVGHRNTSVICTRVSPVDHQLAVSGGQDDQALVWNTQDGSIMFQCTGHTDTVASVGFSHDGSMVATADMKGLVKVWRVDGGQEIWSFDGSEIEWLEWHHAAPVLLVGTKEGQVWMWKIPSGDCKTLAGYGPSALCGKLLADGKSACVGYEDGAVKIWDLKAATVQHTVSGYEGHQSSVLCMDASSKGSLILTGSSDMTAKVINTVTGKVVSTLKCQSREEQAEDTVEAVGFSHTHDLAVTGTLSGSLEVWDLPTKSVRYRCDHPFGVVKLLWSAKNPIFYTACLDGDLRLFDSRNGQLVKTWHGHATSILDFDLARNEELIVTASDDSTAKVFDVRGSYSL